MPKTLNIDELKDYLNKWRELLCLWIRKISVVRISVLPKLICSVGVIPVKIKAGVFVEINRLILKLTRKFKANTVAKTILKEKSRIGVLALSDLKLQ